MTDKESTSGEARANHSSFIEHLRLIHFTLCLTCLIAIIAVAAKSPSSAQRAYYQTNLLLKLQARWNGRKWLDSIADERMVKRPKFEAKVEVTGRGRNLLSLHRFFLYHRRQDFVYHRGQKIVGLPSQQRTRKH